MKKYLALLLAVTLTGCGSFTPEPDPVLELCRRIRTESAGFTARVSADYIDTREVFTVACRWDPEGKLTFSVEDPAELAGIRGEISAPEEKVVFSEEILALPLLAGGKLPPAGGPYVLMKTLCTGKPVSAVREGNTEHMTFRESCGGEVLETEFYLRDGVPAAGEISWRGQRQLTLEISGFAFAGDADRVSRSGGINRLQMWDNTCSGVPYGEP